ncbi:MAG: rane protein [Caulobacter sp.]|nr:rane protein [Caulobacter sp.]
MKSTPMTCDEAAKKLLGRPADDLSEMEREVIERIISRGAISRDLSADDDDQPFGQWLADRVAAVGGSWGFIIAFGVVLVGWILLNLWALGLVGVKPFDPYPFIFLNLMLSMLAAIQAPIIMMSQNRQSEKDREAARHDYEVNLKAELEIMALHEKLDAMRDHDLAELLKQQIELLKRLNS